MDTKITNREQQVKFLQKIHWANNNYGISFTTISAPIDGRFRAFKKEFKTEQSVEGDYGIYDGNALILTLNQDEFILNEMTIDDKVYLSGIIKFINRKDWQNEFMLSGIEKMTK